jgi:hypothetical protein
MDLCCEGCYYRGRCLRSCTTHNAALDSRVFRVRLRRRAYVVRDLAYNGVDNQNLRRRTCHSETHELSRVCHALTRGRCLGVLAKEYKPRCLDAVGDIFELLTWK